MKGLVGLINDGIDGTANLVEKVLYGDEDKDKKKKKKQDEKPDE